MTADRSEQGASPFAQALIEESADALVALALDGRILSWNRGAAAVFGYTVCDLMMPVLTGMELRAELDRTVSDQASSMVFLTGGAFTPGGRSFLDSVANSRLDKPFAVQTLRVLVNERL